MTAAIDTPVTEALYDRPQARNLGFRFRAVLGYTRRKPLGAFGGFLVVSFILIAILAPALSPHDARKSVAPPLEAPSRDHILGTDTLGQDVFSRVLVGSQISLAVGFSVVLINVALSTVLGMVAGYYQGVADYIIQRSGEIWSAFPGLVALLLIVAILGPPHTEGGNLLTIAWDMRVIIFALCIGAVFGGSRIVRGVTLALKQTDYVMAARALGATHTRIIFRHILPNVFPYVIVAATAGLGVVILAEAALSFLGLGVAPGTPSWGQDLAGRNRLYMIEAPWVALAPGIAISLTVLGFNLFGDAMRDVLDPRLRGSGRR
jgi:peptide/nickel transport system permease protein